MAAGQKDQSGICIIDEYLGVSAVLDEQARPAAMDEGFHTAYATVLIILFSCFLRMVSAHGHSVSMV
jgi:hypothetical protein